MYYTFFFNVDAVVCQNNGQFQVWELNIWQFIVIVEIKYFLNLNEYHLPIVILSIHFRQISFFKITKDIQSNNNNNIVLSMLHAELLYFSYFFLYKFYCNKNTISIVSFNLSEKYYSPVNSTNDYSTLITWFFFWVF